ncbi:MAG: phosphate ABC transporter permease subunit PstC [bacterium]
MSEPDLKAQFYDRLSARVIKIVSFVSIAGILLVFTSILYEAVPLFFSSAPQTLPVSKEAEPPLFLGFSRSGQQLSAGWPDGRIKNWTNNYRKIEPDIEKPSRNQKIESMVLGSKGRFAFLLHKNGELTCWDFKKGKQRGRLVPDKPLAELRISPDGRVLMGIGRESGLYLFRIPRLGKLGKVAFLDGTRIIDARFSLWEKDLIAFLDADHNFTIWNREEITYHYNFTKFTPTCFAFSNGGDSIILGKSDGRAIRWHLGTNRVMADYPGVKGAVMNLQSGRDGWNFAFSSDRETVMYNLTTKKELFRRKEGGRFALNDSTEELLIFSSSKGVGLVEPDSRYADFSFNTSFRKNWFEDYRKPEWIWQPESELEPKYGVWVLLFGTLKATAVAMLFSVPVAVLSAVFISYYLPGSLRELVKPMVELLAGIPSVIVGFLALMWLAPWLSAHIFTRELVSRWGIEYQQLNVMVAGMALGFAIIPIIFTISEDAISSVPSSLIQASLAMGATRWQTIKRVVLPCALPGIFASEMLGFGRAVGETMIVLMSTGNPGIIDFSPFTSLRTMSATIAIELPETPFFTTHWRMLFLIGGIMFLITFFINIISSTVITRLRHKMEGTA